MKIALRKHTLITGLLVVSCAARAWADGSEYGSLADSSGPYSTSTYNEGPGFRLGHAPLVIHPGLAADFGYDSNVFYLSNNAVGAGVMRLRAHIDLSTLPPQAFENDRRTEMPKIDFRFGTQVEYREYLTGNDTVQAQRSLNFGAKAGVGILPYGHVTLRIADQFLRTVDPTNAENTRNYTRDTNDASVALRIQPGSRRLTIEIADKLGYTHWETQNLSIGDYISNEGGLKVAWKFLERTEAYFGARAGYYHYFNNRDIDSRPFRVFVGASTLFTTWVGAAANIGYGNSFNVKGPSFNSAIASANVSFYLPYKLKIEAKYDRDFANSLFGNFYSDDFVSVDFSMPLVHRVTASASGGVHFRHYGGLIDPLLIGSTGYTSTERDDRIYEARAELHVRPTAWLSLGATYSLLFDDTDFGFVTPTGTNSARYVKHTVFGRIDVAY